MGPDVSISLEDSQDSTLRLKNQKESEKLKIRNLRNIGRIMTKGNQAKQRMQLNSRKSLRRSSDFSAKIDYS